MNINEVKFLIAFCLLSSVDRSAMVKERYNMLSIPEIIAHVEHEPRIYSKIAYKYAKY